MIWSVELSLGVLLGVQDKKVFDLDSNGIQCAEAVPFSDITADVCMYIHIYIYIYIVSYIYIYIKYIIICITINYIYTYIITENRNVCRCQESNHKCHWPTEVSLTKLEYNWSFLVEFFATFAPIGVPSFSKFKAMGMPFTH